MPLLDEWRDVLSFGLSGQYAFGSESRSLRDVRGKTLAQVRQEVMQKAAESFASRKQDSSQSAGYACALPASSNLCDGTGRCCNTWRVCALCRDPRRCCCRYRQINSDPFHAAFTRAWKRKSRVELDQLGKKRLQFPVFGDRLRKSQPANAISPSLMRTEQGNA